MNKAELVKRVARDTGLTKADVLRVLDAVLVHVTRALKRGDEVKLVYGRPYTKKPGTDEVRKIWGGLVPYDQVWRTGADEATLLTTAKPIVIGALTLAPGTYSLFTYPSADGSAKLIVNKRTGQWGVPYDEKKEAANELGRVDLKKETLDQPVDQFRMAIERGPSGGGVISMMWETTKYSVPFSVKK